MDGHISTQFDEELSGITARLLEMGSLVERQVLCAVEALADFDAAAAVEVLKAEERVNAMEVEIDHDLSRVIALRQPTARDLRLLIGISKATGNLERAGDEAARIARTVEQLVRAGLAIRPRPPVDDISREAGLAASALNRSLDAFARLDTALAVQVIRQDSRIDVGFDGLMRRLVTYMMEDPRTISASIDLVFVAKAIERVGDHAKNLAEQVIYIVKGADIRHTRIDNVEPLIG